MVVAEALDLALPRQFVGQQRLQRLRRVVEELGRQRRLEPGVLTRLGHGFEQLQQLERLGRIEHARALAQVDAADTAFGERRANLERLAAMADQNGNVGGLHRALALRPLEPPCAFQQPLHLRPRRRRHHVLVFTAGMALGIRPPDAQRRYRLAAPVDQPRRLGVRLDGDERNLVAAEGLRMTPEQRIGGLDHGLGRAEIAHQREATRRRPARAQVGMDIGPAKGVDRLLGVADH